jgi:hypothetical protein
MLHASSTAGNAFPHRRTPQLRTNSSGVGGGSNTHGTESSPLRFVVGAMALTRLLLTSALVESTDTDAQRALSTACTGQCAEIIRGESTSHARY